jgi:hypothetical protein
MVIGDRFAWGHVPKTGGEATRAMFQLFPSLIRFIDPGGSDVTHTSFKDREQTIKGKLLALNIRRLPSWVISREHHKAKWGLYPDFEPLPMDPPQQLAESSFPDWRLSTFLDDGRFEIDRWLRMESLAQDFVAFISEFTQVDEAAREAILELGPVNAIDYDHEIGNWFSDDQIELLYRSNPLWAGVERQVYGGTILDSARR